MQKTVQSKSVRFPRLASKALKGHQDWLNPSLGRPTNTLLKLDQKKARTTNVCKGGQRPLKGHQKLKGQISAINTPKPFILPKKKEDFGQFSRQILSHFLSNFSPKYILTHPNIFDSTLFSTITWLCSCTQSSSPQFHILDLRFRVMDVAFQIQSTPFSFHSFFLVNNMLYCFSLHVLAFFFFFFVVVVVVVVASQHVLWFFQHVSLLFAMIYRFDVVGLAFLGQDMSRSRSTCLFLDLHAYAFYVVHVLRST